MLYEYECDDCKWSFDVVCEIKERHNQKCPKCNGKASKLNGNLRVVGTTDNFGFGNIFKDDESGKDIKNWKSWEDAGFRKPLETHKEHHVQEKIKEKINRVNNKVTI